VIHNTKTGFLVKSIEEAVNVLDYIKDINRLNCRKWVEEKFSVDRMVDDYINVYEKILSK
ncbi:MAG: mannose-6-phosphate isomerase, partial [Candidatus Lokiarchaeota archaeon]|nr:mannose-6-phosphate isomerase [Candidatus Lokiarchaeota archaeon]